MEVKIEIADYLSEDEMHDIARDVFRSQLASQLGNKPLDEVVRVVGNQIYKELENEINELVKGDETLRETIKRMTIEVLNKRDSYQYKVFRAPNDWDNTSSLGWQIMQQSIKDHKDDIDKHIQDEIDKYNWTEEIQKQIRDKFEEVGNKVYDAFYELGKLIGRKE
jgi:hypothetical protein